MSKNFSDEAFLHYLYWQKQDKKTLNKINELIIDIGRNGAAKGIGKPERLKHLDCWSRRIDEKNRLLYNVDENKNVEIISCKGHYE